MAAVDPVSLAIAGLSTMSGIQQNRAQQETAQRQQSARQQVALEQRRQQEQAAREKATRALATRRARFGADGVSSAGGSAAAILRGLSAATERGMADNRRLDTLAQRGSPNLFNDTFGLAANLLDTLNKQAPIINLFDT